MKTDELTIQAKILEIKAKWFNSISKRANETTESYEDYDSRFFELQGMFESAEKELQIYREKIKNHLNKKQLKLK